jgi:RHS repeat-associated protein
MYIAYMDNPRLYGTGNAIQHLHYLPFGEDWVDQRNSSWNTPYTFSGKEKDVETGYCYFGARYYDSGLSIWLSVDPMSDKYPSMSPYNYCANNPVILVDPDGRDLVLTGNFAEDVYNYMVTQNPHIKFTKKNGHIIAERNIDDKTGKVMRLTRDERKVFKAINDHSILINLKCVKDGEVSDIDGQSTKIPNGGAFLGNRVINKDRTNADQGINEKNFLAAFDKGDFGLLINHEITEAYKGAKYSRRHDGYAHRASDYLDGTDAPNPAYDYGHRKATQQPSSRVAKEDAERQYEIESAKERAAQKAYFKDRRNFQY